MPRTKQFKVVAVSENYNAFGLKGMIVVGKDGSAYSVAASDLNIHKQGDILVVPRIAKRLAWETLGFEIPTPVENAPPKVVREVWKPRNTNS